MERVRYQSRPPFVPATTLGAIAVALVAFAVVSVVGAAHPEQLVAASAAAGAWLGFLWGARDRGEILIVRLLLAANLFVFAFATHEPLVVEVGVALFAVVFTLGALRSHSRDRL